MTSRSLLHHFSKNGNRGCPEPCTSESVARDRFDQHRARVAPAGLRDAPFAATVSGARMLRTHSVSRCLPGLSTTCRAARSVLHGQAPSGRHDPVLEPDAVEMPCYPVGGRDLLPQEPVHQPVIRAVPARSPRGSPGVGVVGSRTGFIHRLPRTGDGRPRRSRARCRVPVNARRPCSRSPSLLHLLCPLPATTLLAVYRQYS